VPKTNQQKNADASTRAKKKKRPTKHFVRISNLIIQGLLLAVGIAYSVFAFYQWRYMGTQLLLEGATLNLASKTQVDSEANTRLDQRPWVTILSIAGTPKVGAPFAVDVRYQNTGKTPARKVTFRVAGGIFQDEPNRVRKQVREEVLPQVGEVDLAKLISKAKEADSVPLMAPGSQWQDTGDPIEIDQAAIDHVAKGEWTILVCGKTEYSDIFNCPHWTTFAFWYINNAWAAATMYNDADNNACPP
jgi:hypothetical protein